MSSEASDTMPPGSPALQVFSPKRNTNYACDRCRRKKIKCNLLLHGSSNAMQRALSTSGVRLDVQSQCSACAAAKEQCTYGRTATPRAIPKKYVMTLENQWDSLAWLVTQIFMPTYPAGNPEFLKGAEVSNTPSTLPGGNFQVWPMFPPEDLYKKLVDIYFSHINTLWPLFHHPTFQADLAKGRHKTDLGFAQVLLGICAVASRYSSDPRVLAKVPQEFQAGLTSSSYRYRPADRSIWVDDLEGTRTDKAPLINARRDSAGWKYYNRICDYHTATTTEITLTELQTAHLMYQFLLGMPDRKAGSVILGVALRKAQAKGLHHRNKNETINLENECLVVAERTMALETTQALLSLDENIEEELPLKLDDEVWASGKVAPLTTSAVTLAKEPSQLAAFNQYAKFSSEFEKLIKQNRRPFNEEEMKNVFILPYREWLEKIPRHLLVGSDFTANPIWEAQSHFLNMAYGFFGVCICAISVKGTEMSFNDEVLKLVSETFASIDIARLANKRSCRLCSNEHSSLYVNDVPGLIGLATVTAVFVVHLRTKKRNQYSAVSEQEDRSREEEKRAHYNDIVNTCSNILEALQEREIIEHFINLTEADGESSGTESAEPNE
ncbi:hypothetical protein Clacol_009783 [Clathrus columnatus]|uniref:Zn(2)-C6 fungal-type domain-containing protein n=1 Tax=Clathrus columnatus TaxID=1419009 RepID=A0AAV5AUE1_9AGAM|nr:hypothetical protein Clacol_009783 [Clathrus columnatus]